jgi:hypothetical protein
MLSPVPLFHFDTITSPRSEHQKRENTGMEWKLPSSPGRQQVRTTQITDSDSASNSTPASLPSSSTAFFLLYPDSVPEKLDSSCPFSWKSLAPDVARGDRNLSIPHGFSIRITNANRLCNCLLDCSSRFNFDTESVQCWKTPNFLSAFGRVRVYLPVYSMDSEELIHHWNTYWKVNPLKICINFRF